GAILRAEGIEDFRFGEIEVGAGRLEDVGQRLALGVELFALGDELGQGAGHRGSLVGCAPRAAAGCKDGQARRGLRRDLAVGGSNFDRRRAVTEMPATNLCGLRAARKSRVQMVPGDEYVHSAAALA